MSKVTKNLIKYAVQAGLFGTLIFSNLAVATADTELKGLLGNISSMQADFSQKVYSENKKLLNTYSGNVEFKKPKFFRLEVVQPDPSLVVTNGVKLWNYDADLEQVTIQNYSNNKDITPLSFVLDDPKNLNNNFSVVQTGTNCYKLTPKQENANFVNVEVCFANKMLCRVNILDQMGQNSVFEFSKVKNNIQLGSNRFTFNPPDGIDVIGE